MKLRKFQTEMGEKQNAYRLEDKHRILMVAPTGSGKTVVMSKVVSDAVEQGKRVLVMVHRDNLVRQTSAKLEAFGVSHGFIKAGYDEDRTMPVQVASVQSLANRELFAADLIVLDECHTTTSYKICTELFERFAEATFLGFTATPWVLGDTGRLNRLFPSMVTAPSYAELIEAGYLVQPRYFTYPGSDRLKVKGRKGKDGDYSENALNIACNTPKMVKLCVSEFLRLTSPAHTGICFAVGKDHAESLQAEFAANGVSCAVVSAETPDDKRAYLYGLLERKQIRLLISINVLTEGFDCPTIDVVVLARPTLSKSLNFQMVGRGLRIADSKTDCLVLDFADNVFKYRPIDELTAADYVDDGKSSGKKPLKVCVCGAVIGASLMTCPECGHEFEVEEKAEKEVEEPDVSGLRELVRRQKIQGYIDAWKERGITMTGEYVNVNTKTEFTCTKAGHKWRTNPNNINKGSGCPYCSGHKMTPDQWQQRLDAWKERGIVMTGEYVGTHTKTEFTCTKAGHKWVATPDNITQGTGCPYCAGKKKTPEQFQQRVDAWKARGILLTGEYVNVNTKTEFTCTKAGHKWETRPDHINRGTGCPECYKESQKLQSA